MKNSVHRMGTGLLCPFLKPKEGLHAPKYRNVFSRHQWQILYRNKIKSPE